MCPINRSLYLSLREQVVNAIKKGADPNVTLQFRRKRGKTDAQETEGLTYEIEGMIYGN